jgi:DNA ligase-1
MLNDFQNLVNELQATNSSSEKRKILKKYPQCKELLRWTLDPYKKFGVTSDQLKKRQDLIADEKLWRYNNIYDLLEALSDRVSTGHNAIAVVNWFIKENSEYEDLIYRIIDKDLKCRCGATLINNVYPGLIPEFKVALAEDYFKQKNVDLDSGKWMWSRKLDGVRCICRKEGDSIRFFSREGHEFWTLDVLKENILKLEGNFVLDGEICLVDENGKENFQNVMKEIRKKNHTIQNPKYLVFDMLTLKEFDEEDRTHDIGLAYRQTRLKTVSSNLLFDKIDWVIQKWLNTEKDLEDAIKLANDEGWEGLILRKDVPYEGKRTKNMLKVKKMHDAEYEVLTVISGEIDDGQGNKVPGMSAVMIQHKGYNVKVGSGWTYEQRIRFHEHPNEIVGKIITVKYFEETKNQEGGYSLRFPIVKCIHGEKREV